MTSASLRVERKYALTKAASGDYLLPSNDAQTIWRIRRYQDGPSQGLEIPRDRDFWGCWRWTGSSDFVDLSDEGWDRWEFWAGTYDSRAEAIQGALSAS